MTTKPQQLNDSACYREMMMNTLDPEKFLTRYGETQDRVMQHVIWLEVLAIEQKRNPHPATLDALNYVHGWLENVAAKGAWG